MAYLACDICGAEEWEKKCTKCDHVKDIFAELKNDLHDKERKLNRIRDAVLLLLKDLTKDIPDPTNPPQEVLVKTKLILDLWDSAELRWYNAETVQSFLGMTMLDSMVIADAFSLFYRDSHKGDLVAKLNRLKESCEKVSNIHNWQCQLTMTSMDIVSEAKKF